MHNIGWGNGAMAINFSSVSVGHVLRHAFDQVRVIDEQQIQPNVAVSHPYFSIIKDSLHQVMQNQNQNQASVARYAYTYKEFAAYSVPK